MDQAWVGLENPDTKKATYLEMRSKTFYPVVAKGLESCSMAKDGWQKIQDRIDSIDHAMLENIWDHCYIKCGFEEGLSYKAWQMHLFTSSGTHWAGAGDARFYNQGP